MNFHIPDSFTAATARLSRQVRKQAKTAAFDLQLNPAQPGLQLHGLTNSRGANEHYKQLNHLESRDRRGSLGDAQSRDIASL